MVYMKESSGYCSLSMTAAWLVLDAGFLPWHGSNFHARRVKSFLAGPTSVHILQVSVQP